MNIVDAIMLVLVVCSVYDLVKAIITEQGIGSAYLRFLMVVGSILCIPTGPVGQFVGSMLVFVMCAIECSSTLHAKFWEPAFPNG